MSVSSLSEGRRLKSFRLSDVPVDLRVRAANRLMKNEVSGWERLKLGIEAERPSDTKVYVVEQSVWDAVVARSRLDKLTA